MITKHIKISKTEANQVQEWILADKTIPDSNDQDIVKKWTTCFDGIFEADIKLVNTLNGPYLDCILFKNGHQVCVLEPQYLLLGEYPFEYNGETFTVVIELDTNPYCCPMCGKQGEKDDACPTCKGFSYE